MESSPRTPRPKILVADDEPHIVQIIRTHLYRAGYDALTANGYQEALEVARVEHPDLVILDTFMPDMPPFSVTEETEPMPEPTGCRHTRFVAKPETRIVYRCYHVAELIHPFRLDPVIAEPLVLLVGMGTAYRADYDWSDVPGVSLLLKPFGPTELLSAVHTLLPVPDP